VEKILFRESSLEDGEERDVEDVVGEGREGHGKDVKKFFFSLEEKGSSSWSEGRR